MSYYQDETITLHHGDSLVVARGLPSGSVDCIVTSPPYYGLRDYGSDGQYGLEESPAAYVETMRALFSELRRVLADDGTLWLNIGDSYVGSANSGGKSKKRIDARGVESGDSYRISGLPTKGYGMPPKNLMGIPWRVAFALQDDGWILRNSIIWNKTNAMPESVTDRLSGRHENLFLFSKSQRYWFDLEPIREDQSPESLARRERGDLRAKEGWADAYHGNPPKGLARQSDRPVVGKNPGDVWNIATKPFSGAHFAVFPPEIPHRAIVAGCKPGGTVLDPFSGSGTTGMVAQNNGRKYVGIDLSADYLKLSLETRLRNAVLDLDGAS